MSIGVRDVQLMAILLVIPQSWSRPQ